MRKPSIVLLQNIPSENGILNIIESQNHIDFKIKRIFILSDIKNTVERGHHAHKKTDQLLVCLNGEIQIFTEMPDGTKYEYILTNPKCGLFLPAEVWHYMIYKENSIQLVCSSELYAEDDYLRTKDKYRDYYK